MCLCVCELTGTLSGEGAESHGIIIINSMGIIQVSQPLSRSCGTEGNLVSQPLNVWHHLHHLLLPGRLCYGRR
jgi:hypothetical protein